MQHCVTKSTKSCITITYLTALRDEIVAVDHQYEKVWHEQDAEGIASFYTTDAKIMAAGMDVFHGREGMQAILWYISANFGLYFQKCNTLHAAAHYNDPIAISNG